MKERVFLFLVLSILIISSGCARQMIKEPIDFADLRIVVLRNFSLNPEGLKNPGRKAWIFYYGYGPKKGFFYYMTTATVTKEEEDWLAFAWLVPKFYVLYSNFVEIRYYDGQQELSVQFFAK